MFKLDENDKAFAAALQACLPDKVFDAHAHLFRREEIDLGAAPVLGDLPELGGIEYWRESLSAQIGKERVFGGLFFGMPIIPMDNVRERIDRINNFIIEELHSRDMPHAGGLLLVANTSDPAQVESLLDDKLILGFKPYEALNPECGLMSDIHEYLPEWACELANKYSLIVVLHIRKPKALDDERNIDEINALCAGFPRMKLVLAHAGCGFNMYNTINGCRKLDNAANLWFDFSALCEPSAFTALIKTFGAKRMLWGSDSPVSLRKGRFVTLGDSFIGLQRDTVKRPINDGTLVGMENLRAVLHAAQDCRLNSEELEDIFYNNAMRLLER